MEKELYLSELKSMVLQAGYDEQYYTLCATYASRLVDNNLPVLFDAAHFSKVIGVDQRIIYKMIFANNRFYTEASIPKKSGGVRTLQIPALELKIIQRWIVDNILKKIKISDYATGFCDNTNIVKNAERHLNKECVISLDIKDFFPSVSFETVFRIFNYYGYTKELSFLFAKLCTYENYLPQGSPASPWISNISCLKIDKRLSRLAQTYEADYSRYADDITFSGSKHIGKIISISKKILQEEGFAINDKKTRIAYKKDRQEVTGLIVNNTDVRVNKKYKKSVWQEIYYCKKFGVSNHLKHIECNKAFYKEHLYGKAYFIHMVEPTEGRKMIAELNTIIWDY